VDVLISRLDLAKIADNCYSLKIFEETSKRNAKIPDYIPREDFTLRKLFTSVLDLRSVPKKVSQDCPNTVFCTCLFSYLLLALPSFVQPLLRCLAEHTSSSSERRRLLCLCSREGASEYLTIFRGQNVGLIDVLLSFPSCRPPVEAVLEHLPRLAPRPYSVASVQKNGLVDVVFNVVEIPCGSARTYPRRGLCTGHFEDMSEAKAEKRVRDRASERGRSNLQGGQRALHCTALHCTALHCTALHCTALHAFF
jgi:methionine synthase reductase